jgi:hypothetical protein
MVSVRKLDVDVGKLFENEQLNGTGGSSGCTGVCTGEKVYDFGNMLTVVSDASGDTFPRLRGASKPPLETQRQW